MISLKLARTPIGFVPFCSRFYSFPVVAFYYQLHSLLFHHYFHVHYYHMYMSCWKAWATSQHRVYGSCKQMYFYVMYLIMLQLFQMLLYGRYHQLLKQETCMYVHWFAQLLEWVLFTTDGKSTTCPTTAG